MLIYDVVSMKWVSLFENADIDTKLYLLCVIGEITIDNKIIDNYDNDNKLTLLLLLLSYTNTRHPVPIRIGTELLKGCDCCVE